MLKLFSNHEELFDYETKDRKTPVDIAAEYGSPDILQRLVGHETFKKIDKVEGTPALINAAIRHRENDVLNFLKREYEHIIHSHLNTLHFACRQLHGHKMIAHLINGQSIMYQDKKTGTSPLMVAVKHRQTQCVQELLSHRDFKVEAIQLVNPINLQTVFHMCAEVNRTEITNAICSPRWLSVLSILCTDIDGNTPLHICAKVGNSNMTRILLEFISNRSSSKTTISQSNAHRSMTNLDVDGRVPKKQANTKTHVQKYNTTANTDVHKLLMKKNKEKYTALHVAIYNGNFNVINEMIVYCDPSVVNACDAQWRTSLHMAAEKGEKFGCSI